MSSTQGVPENCNLRESASITSSRGFPKDRMSCSAVSPMTPFNPGKFMTVGLEKDGGGGGGGMVAGVRPPRLGVLEVVPDVCVPVDDGAISLALLTQAPSKTAGKSAPKVRIFNFIACLSFWPRLLHAPNAFRLLRL